MGPLIVPPSDAEQSTSGKSRSSRGLLIPFLMFLVLAVVVGKPLLRILYYASGVEGRVHQAHFDSQGW
jgi:hypothetical protein